MKNLYLLFCFIMVVFLWNLVVLLLNWGFNIIFFFLFINLYLWLKLFFVVGFLFENRVILLLKGYVLVNVVFIIKLFFLFIYLCLYWLLFIIVIKVSLLLNLFIWKNNVFVNVFFV